MVSVGVIFNVIVNRLTAYFTATDKSPVQEIAKSTRFGPATTILSGLAEGYESSTWSVLTIAGGHHGFRAHLRRPRRRSTSSTAWR